MAFERSNLSRLRSERRRIERRIGKAEWQIANDPRADLVGLSELADALYVRAERLTAKIDAELQADERKRLRRALLANVG